VGRGRGSRLYTEKSRDEALGMHSGLRSASLHGDSDAVRGRYWDRSAGTRGVADSPGETDAPYGRLQITAPEKTLLRRSMRGTRRRVNVHLLPFRQDSHVGLRRGV
jgi:hypothetical protein